MKKKVSIDFSCLGECSKNVLWTMKLLPDFQIFCEETMIEFKFLGEVIL